MPQAPAFNAPRLGDVQVAIAQIPGSANLLMVMPSEQVLIPITAQITVGPHGELFYTILGYFDLVSLTYTPV